MQIINNYWMRLSVISRIIKPQAEEDNAKRRLDNSRYHAKTEFNNYFIIHMELFFFYSLYDLFFGIILFYSLYENKKPAFASFTNYYLQAGRHNYRIPRIICRCDVIIANTKNYYSLCVRSPF